MRDCGAGLWPLINERHYSLPSRLAANIPNVWYSSFGPIIGLEFSHWEMSTRHSLYGWTVNLILKMRRLNIVSNNICRVVILILKYHFWDLHFGNLKLGIWTSNLPTVKDYDKVKIQCRFYIVFNLSLSTNVDTDNIKHFYISCISGIIIRHSM